MGASGILAHFGVAVNEAGRPLGMFEANAAFRSAPGLDSARWIAGLDGALELSRACADNRVMTVCDRRGLSNAVIGVRVLNEWNQR